MILTVRQAEDQICPYQSSAAGRVNCKSEGCALWRWALPEKIAGGNLPKGIKVGYCGAGGKPESMVPESF